MSEFGSGVIVPLVKFTQHLNDRRAEDLRLAIRWAEMDPSDRLLLIENGASPYAKIITMSDHMDMDDVLDTLGTMWANGASDHLIDLDLSVAPKSMVTLRKIMLELRYGKIGGTTRKFNETQWREILSLWKEAAMDIDEMLGANSDWGDWE